MKADGGEGSEPPRSRKCRNICLAATAAVGVIVLILVVLCLTVFKAKDPETTVNSVVLRNLQADLNIPKVSVDVNVTLDVDLSVKNPNKVGFKYTNSTASLNYRGVLVGQVPIGAGEISSDQTKPMDVTLTIMADRFLGKTPELLSDVAAGTIPFNTVTKISGKVTILGIFKVHVVSTTSCDFNVDVSSKTAGDQLFSGILVATLLLLLTVVYKAKNPIITVDVVVLRDLRVDNNTPTRVAVGLNLSLQNPNKVAFKYTNSTAVLIYWGAVTGETFIEGGEISAGNTKAMNVTLTISADGFLGN